MTEPELNTGTTTCSINEYKEKVNILNDFINALCKVYIEYNVGITCTDSLHMGNDLQESVRCLTNANISLDTIKLLTKPKITVISQSINPDDKWCDQYRCPKCYYGGITHTFKFCPNCGIEISCKMNI